MPVSGRKAAELGGAGPPGYPRAMSRFRATLRARLGPRVRTRLARRAAECAEHRDRVAGLRDDAAALAARVTAVEATLQRLRADQELWSQPFHGEMTIDQAWRRHPGAPGIFARFHLPSCDTCAVRHDETLAEAVTAYDLDGEALLQALNSLLGES